MSVHTVEAHLSRTYRKLGVRSRAALARRLAASGEQAVKEQQAKVWGSPGFPRRPRGRSFGAWSTSSSATCRGVSRSELECTLVALRRTTREMRGEGMPVRYLGSTIVPGDEACFCQFAGPSQAAVAEANRRAGVAFDRIVPAIAVSAATRRISDV
jgi:hypothetical protein